MTREDIIEQLNLAIDLIKQDGKDWLDDRDIPMLEECVRALSKEPCKGQIMTREEALDYAKSELDAAYKRAEKIGHKGKTRYIEVLEMAIQTLSQEPCEKCAMKNINSNYCKNCMVTEYHGKKVSVPTKFIEQEPCETCGYAEGSPFCLQYCPYDAERKKKQESCDDAISREAVLEAVSEGCQELRGVYGRCEELINALPSVTQKSGKWKVTPMSKIAYCSICDELIKDIPANIVTQFEFCPNCGCHMVKPQESER